MKETNYMKELELKNELEVEVTINDLATKLDIPAPTIRAWTRTPVNGMVWSKEMINIDKVREQLSKRFEDDEFESIMNCSIGQIVIVKSERVTNDYITLDELEVGKMYRIHNYSFTKDVKYEGTCDLNDTKLYIFTNEKGYHTYNLEMLSRDNMKIERL